MTYFTVVLQRESPSQQWGFTLVGGFDCNLTPLVVEKVIAGSPSYYSGLKSGDIIDQINYQPTSHLSHQRATDLIKASLYSVNLQVERPLPTSSFLTPPCSPQTQTMSYSTPIPVQMYSTQNNTLSPTGSSLSAGSLYRPQHLCSTNQAGIIPSFDHVTRDYACPLAQEKRQFYEDRARERASVITQPHRTLPICTPKPKSVHDYAIGSYLRYVKDPNWHTTPTRSSIPQSEKLRQVATQYGATPNDRLVNLQYNSPINMYSSQNVAKALSPNSARGQDAEQDITASPTWRYLKEEDDLRRQQRQSPAFNRNTYPVQSNSFNLLSTSLLDAPGC